jgi:hypothetical protein
LFRLVLDSEEKREPVSDIDTAVVDSLKVLDLKWPIREQSNRARVCPLLDNSGHWSPSFDHLVGAVGQRLTQTKPRANVPGFFIGRRSNVKNRFRLQ